MSTRRSTSMVILFLLLVSSFYTSVTLADGESSFQPVGSTEVLTVTKDGVVETTVTQAFTNNVPDLSTSKTINGQTVQYANCAGAATNGSFIYHCWAKTQRTAGSGTYRTEAHAALVPDTLYGNPVFGYTTHPCAQDFQTNATAQTCQSPNFNSWHGRKWGIISGHMFDTDLVNPYADQCNGCIDWLFTTP